VGTTPYADGDEPRLPAKAPILPKPGDVIRYEFLWPDGAEQGLDSDKERPCAVVLTVGPGPNPVVYVAPITSRDPRDARAIELQAGGPLGLKTSGWIIPWALNVFVWMGYDVRPAPEPKGAFWRYGALAGPLRNRLAQAVKAAIGDGRLKRVSRSE
jgi:hypothetical protein